MKINLDGCQNFRDIGGYLTLDGHKIKHGFIYRSDGLYRLSDKDKQLLKELNLKSIIDFRSDEEVAFIADDKIENTMYYHQSALKTKDGLQNFHFFSLLNYQSSEADIMNVSQFVRDGYDVLPLGNRAYQKVFDLMLNDEVPLVFHCSSGKDRTGVMCYLIMKLLGISDEECLKDYLLSNTYLYDETLHGAHSLNLNLELTNKVVDVCLVHEAYLKRALTVIFSKYSSWEDFFEQEYDLTHEKRRYLQDKFLE